jgi:hypothetical protein
MGDILNSVGNFSSLRDTLVNVALEWQNKFGVAPHITSAISEYDVALLVGCAESDYSLQMALRTAVGRGYDFIYDNKRYQIKANRPSGKPGSNVTLVSNPTNDEWDRLVWVLYDKNFVMQEAWSWELDEFRRQFKPKQRLSPSHMRQGKCLYKAHT